MAKQEVVKTPLKKVKAEFQLIGKAKVTDYTFKIDEESKSSDWVYNVLNLGVDCGNGNVVYCDMSGGYGSERDNVLRVHGLKENEEGKMIDDFDNKFTIDWDDRFDESILETVGKNCFIKVGLEKDTKDKTFSKEFLSAYDAIAYIKDNLEDGMVINAKGDLKYSTYNENVQIKKEVTSLFLSKAEDESKYKASFAQTILVDTDSVQKPDGEKGIIPIDAYVIDYVGKIDGQEIKKNVAFTKTFELLIDKEKPENTKKLVTKMFKPEKKGKLVEVTVEGDLIEGQSVVNITEDDIPEDIKELIELGAYTMEEALSKCAVGNGSREKRLVIKKPAITYQGKGEDRKPIIAIDKNKYTEEDLVFLSQLILEKEDGTSNNDEGSEEDEKDDSEDSSNDWMNALNDL
jgi:hypothetical protein